MGFFFVVVLLNLDVIFKTSVSGVHQQAFVSLWNVTGEGPTLSQGKNQNAILMQRESDKKKPGLSPALRNITSDK